MKSNHDIVNSKEDIVKISKNCQINWENITKSSGYLNENDVNYTRKIGTVATDFLKNCDEINIDLITECIFVVDFFNGGGGTTMFINFIISKYKYYNNFLVIRKIKNKLYLTLNDEYLIKTFENETDVFEFITKINVTKIFVNHLLDYSLSFFNNLYNYKCKKNIKLITITHDYYMFFNKIQPTYKEMNTIIKDNTNFNLDFFDEIITQDVCNLNLINRYRKQKINMRLISLPDYYKREKCLEFINEKITVGIIGNITTNKGAEQLKHLIKIMPNVNFVVFGMFNCRNPNLNCYSYNSITVLNELLVKHKPDVLLELSIWPETYCYTLTLSLLTNLPLIILDKINESVIINRMKKISSNFIIIKTLNEIKNYINELTVTKKTTTLYTISPRIHFSEGWNEMFISGYNKNVKMNTKLIYKDKKMNLLKYVIYFPQFYSFEINNHLFYKGYTDITNLNLLLKKDYLNEILTPNFMNFNITNITDYNILNNDNIMNDQFKLLDDYNLDGFACYYYWFSVNSQNRDHMVMRESVDKLFKMAENYNKNIFFIWANENWSNNQAMGLTNNVKLINEYSIDEFKSNFDNILPYFRNSKYLKYNNKPVFMIYHSFLIPTQYIKIFEDTLNMLCLENGFSGISIFWNIMKPLDLVEDYDYKKFYINFNYKTNKDFRYMKDSQAVIDYQKYVNFCNDEIENDVVQTLVFDFDNNARLIKPERSKLSSLCINNYHFLKIKFINMLLNKYSKRDDNNIIIINSLNEWGEKMAIEPSNEIGFYYLNLLKKYL